MPPDAFTAPAAATDDRGDFVQGDFPAVECAQFQKSTCGELLRSTVTVYISRNVICSSWIRVACVAAQAGSRHPPPAAAVAARRTRAGSVATKSYLMSVIIRFSQCFEFEFVTRNSGAP